jgi:hypothetical protein
LIVLDEGSLLLFDLANLLEIATLTVELERRIEGTVSCHRL